MTNSSLMSSMTGLQNWSLIPNFTFNGTFSANVSGKSLVSGVAKIPFTSAVAMAMTALGLIANGTLMIVFVKDQSLRTPFNVYLINLITANLLSILVVYPINVVDMLHPIWFMGDAACLFYQYGRFVVQAGIFNAHMLIAINRIWSVIHPYSYRLAHFRMSGPAKVCICMWIYVHVFTLPGLMPELVTRLIPVNGRRCFFTPIVQSSFDVAVQFIIFDLPLFTMISAFPIIFVAQRIRRRVFTSARLSVNSSGTQPADLNLTNRGTVTTGTSVSVANQPLDDSQMSAPPQLSSLARSSRVRPYIYQAKKSSGGFLVLGLLTISVLICWAPSMTLFTVSLFQPVPYPLAYQIIVVIFSFQTTLDPILFTIALKNLRVALKRLCRCSVEET